MRGSLPLRQLQQKLGNIGHEISASGLQKIESGVRRVAVDDLTALAVALGVNPNALLLPAASGEPAGVTGGDAVDLTSIWDWVEGRAPIDGTHGNNGDFQRRIRPGAIEWTREMAVDSFEIDLRARLDEIGNNVKALIRQAGKEEPLAHGDR